MLRYQWRADDGEHVLELAPIAGTRGTPYEFGAPHCRPVAVDDFHLATAPVTQALSVHVMGTSPAADDHARRPVDDISWNRIAMPGGFLVFGWKRGWRLVSRPPGWRTTYVHDVALKKPNQLGLYDMSGNVWEWCDDACEDGERRLRGGCHDNWDIHCNVSFRYSFSQDAGGAAIGFRLALS